MNIIEVYRNYIFAMQEREEFGDKYGDTDEIIKRYEEILNKHNIKTNRLVLEKKSNKKSL